MPQEFQVVRCYACQVFQVQQVKKTPKWVCKMCGEKQSLKKEYSCGSGIDCRRHVQKLNMVVGEWLDANVPQQMQPCSSIHNEGALDQTTTKENRIPNKTKESSRWQAYVDGQDADEEPLHAVDMLPPFESVQVTLDRPQHQRRGRRECDRWNSGRKRKRDDEQNTPSESSSRNTFGSTLKTSNSQNQDKAFPGQHVISFPAKTAKESPEHEEVFKVKSESDITNPSRKTSKWNGLGTQKPEVTQHTSSKWGQFLEDTSDEECPFQETDANVRGNKKTTQNLSCVLFNSSKCQNSNAESENGLKPERPSKLQESFAKEVENSTTSKLHKLDRGICSVASFASRENEFYKTSMFSVEDESVLEDFLKDDW